jgi:hypothetical protein
MQSGPKPGEPTGPTSLSFAPVGLDIGPMNDDDEEHIHEELIADPGSVRVATTRRRLGRAVWAVLGAAALVSLFSIVGVLARAAHRRAETPATANPLTRAETAGPAPSIDAPGDTKRAETAAIPAPAPEPPSTGTVRLRRPASPSRVWLDGSKLTAASSVVSCGTHQIKVGARARPRSVDVPCGGQIDITH